MSDCTYSILGLGPYDGYYCTKHYVGDGEETTYTFPFAYLGQESWDGEKSAYIRVWLNGIETTQFTMPTASSIDFATAPGVNVCIKIRRDTDLTDRKVNFQSGSRNTAGSKNLDSQNAFYLIQELADQLYDASLANAGEGASFNSYQWTGDGSETTFPMSTTYGPNDETGITNEAEVLVKINGAIQQTDAYTLTDVSGITNVVFDAAPTNEAAIEAVTMTSGTPQRLELDDGEIAGAKLADCAIDSTTWQRVVCIDDLGTPGEVMIWDEAPGGAALDIRELTHEDIGDFDDGVRENRPTDLATCNTNLNLGSNKIVSMAAGSADTDAVNVAQMTAAISAAIPTGTVPRIVSGSLSFNSTTYTTLDLGFDYDTLILNVQFDESYTTTGGGNHTYDDSRTYTQLASDGSSEIEYVFREGRAQFTGNLYAFKIQQISNGFQYKRSGASSDTITIRYTAIKYS